MLRTSNTSPHCTVAAAKQALAIIVALVLSPLAMAQPAEWPRVITLSVDATDLDLVLRVRSWSDQACGAQHHGEDGKFVFHSCLLK